MKTLREYIDQIDNLQEGWKKGAALGGVVGGAVGGIPGAIIGAGLGGVAQHYSDEEEKKKYSADREEAKKGIFTNEFIKIVNDLKAKNYSPAQIGYVIVGPDGAGAPAGAARNLSTIDFHIVDDLAGKAYETGKGMDWHRLGLLILRQIEQGSNRIVKSYDKWDQETDVNETATPDAVKRIEQLVQYK